MISKKNFLRLADALLVALLITLVAKVGWLDEIDLRLCDKFFQEEGARNADIIVLGIDKATLNKLGPNSSIRRRDMAQAISYLNNHDPDARPAVIGIDGLFTGENSADPEGDKLLAQAAAQFGNVVVGSEADLDDEDIAEESANPYAPWDKTWPWVPPFPALKESAATGHLNAPNEEDGITRHDLLYVNVEERGQLYSFARVIYEKWCDYKGLEPKPPPKTEGNGIYYLTFTAKSYSCGKNFGDLLAGTISSEVYRDKIVLIGPYAPGMQDAFPTSLDRADLMYGVDIHANAIQAFQGGKFLYEAGQSTQLIILFIVTCLAEFFFRRGKMKHMLGGWLIISIGWLVLCEIFRRQGIILHVSWIPLSVSVLFIGAVASNYILAREEKEQVTATFERYVDPAVMRQLLDGGSKSVKLGGELKNIAVLFVDIRGFTTMSEELSPTTVVEILNRYLTLTTACIRRYHGTLDKFVGDCTMAFWNAPLEQERPVELACRAALDMIAGSEKLGAELMERHGRKISFGVGIHWGSAVVGNIGTPFRMDYTAIGDTVNTAARLEANARGGTILISRAVADILGARGNVTSLGNSIKLKGKSEDFEILKLNSLNETEEE
ncbi:MAG: adenylate/guanylate cyclase domain-containing protein [Selenomonadaceae bacterium]|nr:adenylate/guanylate cyclase domain-containing protein [Selenomonadaceae bacterium]